MLKVKETTNKVDQLEDLFGNLVLKEYEEEKEAPTVPKMNNEQYLEYQKKKREQKKEHAQKLQSKNEIIANEMVGKSAIEQLNIAKKHGLVVTKNGRLDKRIKQNKEILELLDSL